MEPYKIITGSVENLSLVKPLWEELNRLHFELSTYFKERFKNNTWKNREAELIKKSEKLFVQFAQRNNGDLIGYCICTIDKVDNGIGELDSIFIKETHRKSGLGKQLMRNALEWFKSNQTRTVTLLVGVGNEEVIKYYQQFGFNPIHIVMKKD